MSPRGGWLSLLAAAALSVTAAGCQVMGDDGESGTEAFSVPTHAAEGEERDVILSNVFALSRIADERAQGLPDERIAAWHLHYVTTKEGFEGNVVYGAGYDGQVLLMLVMAKDAKSLVIVQPNDDDESEGSLAKLADNPHEPLSPVLLPWIHDELARLSKLDSSSNGGIETEALTGKCVARVSTMLLTLVAGVVAGPVGGFVASAVEAAAWGDFEGAAFVGGVGAGVVVTDAMKKSGSALIRTTGNALKGAGVVGLVGLVGVGLYLDPKATLTSLIPAQCKSE